MSSIGDDHCQPGAYTVIQKALSRVTIAPTTGGIAVLANAAVAPASAGMSAAGVILLIVVIVIAVGAYWAPTIVGWRRHVPNLGSIIVLNFLLGWTLVGWAVALAMSVKTIAPPVTLTQAQGWGQPPQQGYGYPPQQPYGQPGPYGPPQPYGSPQQYGQPAPFEVTQPTEQPQRARWPEQPQS